MDDKAFTLQFQSDTVDARTQYILQRSGLIGLYFIAEAARVAREFFFVSLFVRPGDNINLTKTFEVSPTLR